MASIVFDNPEFLFLLLALPILVVVHLLLFKATKRKAMLFSNLETLKRVTGKNPLTKNIGVLVLRLLALTAIILALSGPNLWYEGQAQTSDYVIAIDTSASMTANDLTPDRLAAAKQSAISFIDSLEGDASVGVITFSGTVVVEQPLTDDLVSAKQAIERASVQVISGTDISGAIITGTNLLLGSDKGRVMLLFTDGSSTAGAFQEDPVQRGTAYAVNNQVVVHTIGIGREGYSPTGYLPRIYNITAAYDESTLAYVANQTSGISVRAVDDDQLAVAYQEISANAESTLQSRSYSIWLLVAGLLLLFIEWGLTNTRFRLIP